MYGKHFSSTYTGSLVGAGLNVFAVWGYVIANTARGCVELNPKLLAAILGGTEDEIRAAITCLSKPDPSSRSKEHEGRRLLKEGEFLYAVPTAETYRKIINEDDRREYMRVKQQEHRARVKCQGMSGKMSTHTDLEAEVEEKKRLSGAHCGKPVDNFIGEPTDLGKILKEGGNETDWTAASWEAFIGQVKDAVWKRLFSKRRLDVLKVRPPAKALAILIEMQRAKKQPRTADQVTQFFFYRAKERKFGDRTYDMAKAILRRAHRD